CFQILVRPASSWLQASTLQLLPLASQVFCCVNPLDKSNLRPSILYSFHQHSITLSVKYFVAGDSWFISYPTLNAWRGTGLNQGLLAAGRLFAASQYILTIGDWPNWWLSAISIITAIPSR